MEEVKAHLSICFPGWIDHRGIGDSWDHNDVSKKPGTPVSEFPSVFMADGCHSLKWLLRMLPLQREMGFLLSVSIRQL